MEIGRALADPFEEFRKPRMASQGFGRVVNSGKLGFGQRGVDFVVTNLVDQDCWTALAAAQFGDKVMQALRGIRQDGTVTERAYGVVFHGK